MSVSEEVKKVVADFISKSQLKDKTEGMGKGLLLAAGLADESNQLTRNIQGQVDQLVIEGDSSVEAAQARVDADGYVFSTLKKRLDGRDQETNSQLAHTMTQAEFDSWVTTLLDGGPSIFMETYASLIASYPNGSSGVALVRETDPAKIYVWNGTSWESYGEYQGVEVKDETITTSKLAKKAVTSEKTDYLTDGIFEDSVQNIMPNLLSARGDFYDPTTGSFVSSANTQNFKNTGKIYLLEKGIIESYGNNSLVFFDASDVFIYSTQHGGDTDLQIKRRIEPPEKAVYFIANVPKAYWWDAEDSTYPDLTATLKFIPKKSKMKTLRVVEDNFEKIIDPGFIPINLLEKLTMSEPNNAIDAITGAYKTQSNQKYSSWTEALPINYRSKGVSQILFKNSNDEFMSFYFNYNTDSKLATWQSWTPPVGAVKMAINLTAYYFERAELYQMENQNKKAYFSNSAMDSKLQVLLPVSANEAVLQLGDSIIGNASYPSDISTAVSQRLGSNVINGGFGGTRAAVHPNVHFNNFSLFNLVDAIVSGDFSAQEASSLVTGIGMPEYFKTKVALLKSLTMKKVKVITLSFGTNDWNGAVALDNPLNPFDTNTYLGSIRYSIKKLQETYPGLKIIIGTPIYRFVEDGTKDSDTWLAGEKKLTDFVDALFPFGKEVKIPVIDCYYTLGINKFNRHHYFNSADGTHPNFRGNRLIGERYANEIKIYY